MESVVKGLNDSSYKMYMICEIIGEKGDVTLTFQTMAISRFAIKIYILSQSYNYKQYIDFFLPF